MKDSFLFFLRCSFKAQSEEENVNKALKFP